MNRLGKQSSAKIRKRQLSGVGMVVLAVLAAGLTFNHRDTRTIGNADPDCQQAIAPDTSLDPAQLKQLDQKLGATPEAVHQLLGSPNCQLPKAAFRSGAIASREAYQLQTGDRAILAYEGDRYIGYDLESATADAPNHREIEIEQTWGLQTGESVAGYAVVGGLGRISIEANQAIYAPNDGALTGQFIFIHKGELMEGRDDCAIFSSPEMPAYLLHFCGLKQRQVGTVKQGQSLGKARGYLYVALLRRDGKWTFVPPAKELLRRLLHSTR